MPLPLPNLDDRRWADLVDEGRALIPRRPTRWTDHNISDPGVMLLELFAAMTESGTYRLNRITVAHRLKFLALIGQSPLPPRAGRAMLHFSPKPAAASFDLTAGVEFEARQVNGHVVAFRTLVPVHVADVRIAAVQIEEGGSSGVADRTTEWRNGLPIRVFGRDPKAGSAFYLGFDAIPATESIALAMRWARPGADAAARALQSADERAALVAERRAWRKACRKPLPVIACPGSIAPVDNDFSTSPHHSARVVWEAWTGAWAPLTPTAPTAALTPGQVADDTRSLTLDGLVAVNLPVGIVRSKKGSVVTPLFYLRCRLTAGTYDAAPVLLNVVPNAVPVEQSTPMWQRFTIPAAVTPTGTAPAPGAFTGIRTTFDKAGRIFTLAFVAAGAGVPSVAVIDFDKAPGVEGHVTLEVVRAGVGSGLPDQQVTLPGRAIASDEALAVFSHDGVAWQQWQLRPDFDASKRIDWHAVPDATNGTVTFGNGERGHVVPKDHVLFVAGRVTAAAAGAVRAQTRLALSRSPENDWRLASFSPSDRAAISAMTAAAWPAYGAADAETLAHASGRAAEVLHAHDRLVDLAESARTHTLDGIAPERVRDLPAPTNAVNALDLERIALATPGTRLARARAWSDTYSQQACLTVPGFVTLVIVPDLDTAQPQPSAGLCRAVKRYVDRHRMVTTLVSVVGPTYVVVSVSASIRVLRGASAGQIQPLVVAALDRFLDPRIGGPDGRGWPFGRDVYRSEILQLIDGVPGVDHVPDLSLSASGGSPQCGNLTLCPTWLVASGRHRISFA